MNEDIRIADYEGLIREILDSGGEFRIYPRGTSMLPLLRQGIDSVVLKRLDTAPAKNDILFYQRSDGSYVLHRVHSVTPNGLVFWGDNHTQLEYGIASSQVIGQVCRIFRGEREVLPDTPGYRLYLWLWNKRRLRRVLLAFTHLLHRNLLK